MDLTHPISSIVPSIDGRVLTVLAHTSRPMAGRQVARLIPDVSLRGVQRVLSRLEAHGLVTADPYGHAVLFAANEKHLLWPAVLALVEAADGVNRRLRDLIRESAERSAGAGGAEQASIALFGSVARGTSSPDSDVDLLVVTSRDREDQHVAALVDDLVEDVMNGTGNRCNVYHATRARLSELVRDQDPMVASWLHDAEMVHGPDLRPMLRGAPWPA